MLPTPLQTVLEAALDTRLLAARPVGGGMINHAACVETTQGRLFLKWKADAPPGFFQAEADGLRRLQATQTFRIPHVLRFQDQATTTPIPFLALEYLEPVAVSGPRFDQQTGETLAALHQHLAPNRAFGLETDNFIGNLPQSNTFHPDWPSFYRECRLLPQIAIARSLGRLPATRERLLMTLLDRLDSLLEGLTEPPSLLHGDLWAGNFFATAPHQPTLVDPALSYSNREMEIAYMELFGGFSAPLFAAYRAAYPLDPDYVRRRPLHQLYPLLVHLNHFGEQYGPDVEAACHRSLSPTSR